MIGTEFMEMEVSRSESGSNLKKALAGRLVVLKSRFQLLHISKFVSRHFVRCRHRQVKEPATFTHS
jgi:hypothetical protein